MAWWSQFFERRAHVWPSPPLLDFIAAGPTVAGMSVDALTATKVPAVFSCCQVLAQDLARTPIRLRQQVDEDTYEDATDHPLWEILHDLANPELTAYQFKSAMQWALLVYGRAYAEVVREAGRVTQLWPLDPAAMVVDRTPARVKRWSYYAGGQTYTWLFDPSQPPILELTSESPIQRCRDLIGTALALQQYVGAFFINYARPPGVLQAAGSISDGTAQRLRDSWASGYGGAANRGKVPVLDGGVEFKPIGQENDSAQVNEMWRSLNEQIAGAFRVPTWKIGDLSKTTYSNMEQGELSYVTSTLDPIFELWEEAIRRDLLTTRQFGMFTVEFDRHALVRNDMKSLNDSLQAGINAGYLSQNDARKALGLNPIENGDVYRVNQALAPVSQSSQTSQPQEVPRVA
jgi:HK97 family phage portal protein